MVLPISEFGEESPAVVHRMRATLGATLALHFSAKNEERGAGPPPRRRAQFLVCRDESKIVQPILSAFNF
jgi:hypothetical protein